MMGTLVHSECIVFQSTTMRLFSAAILLGVLQLTTALSGEFSRRDALLSVATIPLLPLPALAAEGLGSKLAKRDPSLLKNSVFNVPPSAQRYPDFMRGNWHVTSRFNGYIFPSTKIEKSRLLKNVQVPGFQKCSIAAVCDIGKEETAYDMHIDRATGLEDRSFTLTSQIDAFLGYKAVAEVIYDSNKNPNRISVDFVEYKTRNAERIELFCNARESEVYEQEGIPVFVYSEYIRQVTFGGSADVGVARQVVGNYAHFWTWKKKDDSKLMGNLLTAAYLDPQDALFFDEPSKPVAIYSHVLTADRVL
jgi:hypothetical protein